MDNICNPEDLWLPLMTAALTGAGLTLTGGKFFTDILVDDMQHAFGKKALAKDIINIIEDLKNWFSTFFLLIVITFLFSDVAIILYLVINRSEGVYLSYVTFFGAVVSIIFMLHVFLSFLRDIKMPDTIQKMKAKEFNPKVNNIIHKVGHPQKGSPIFLTSNSASDYHRLEPDLGSNDINSYIVPIDTKGYRLNDAIAYSEFTPDTIKMTLESYCKTDPQFARSLNYYPSIVLPYETANIEGFLEKLENVLENKFNIVVGPNLDSDEIDSIVKWYNESWPDDQRIRRVGNPSFNSPIFLTSSSPAEYSKTMNILLQENISSYVIVLDTKKTSIITAVDNGINMPLLIRNLINELILEDKNFAERMRKNPSIVIPHDMLDFIEVISNQFNGTIDIVSGPDESHPNDITEWINELCNKKYIDNLGKYF